LRELVRELFYVTPPCGVKRCRALLKHGAVDPRKSVEKSMAMILHVLPLAPRRDA
jgi:hypothetical protein